ncbi:Uncharacterised protein [Chlamydia trachomatis]|nr:Uncharacterised protein [Chlamydia trachomatis]
MYHIFCIHSSVEGHLGSFQLLAIINKAAMNIVEHVSFLPVGAVQWASLSSDGRLGHLLIHMQLESRAPGYWLVHNVVPPIGLQIPLAPWVLSLAPPLGAL